MEEAQQIALILDHVTWPVTVLVSVFFVTFVYLWRS